MTDGNGTGTRDRQWGSRHDILTFIVGTGILAEEALYQTAPRRDFLFIALVLMAIPGFRPIAEAALQIVLRWLTRDTNGKR